MDNTLNATPRSFVLWRTLFIFFVSLVIVAAVLVYLFISAEHAAAKSATQAVASRVVERATQRIHAVYESVGGDVRLLANLPSLQQWLALGTDTALDEAEKRFLLFSRHRPMYAQIRYIDASGHERVRVDQGVDGNPRVIEAFGLQDKSERYYVSGTLSLAHGEIYVSDFDLEVERGAIAQPINPTLRFCTPVADRDGRKRGLVLISYRGQALIDKLETIGREFMQGPLNVSERDAPHMQLWLINAQGYWLIGPRSEDEWSFATAHRTPRTMPRVFPEAWATIQAGARRGQFVSRGNLFTFEWVTWGTPERAAAALETATAPSLIVMTFVPEFVFRGYLARLIERLRPFLLALLALLLGFAWLLTRQKTARQAAERDIRVNETRFRTLLESAPDAVVVTDCNGQIVLVNARAEELFNYERDELIGQNVDCLVPEQYRAPHAAHRADYVAAPITREMAASSDLVGRRRDGTEVPIGISLSPVEIEGETLILSAVRDMTAQREAERQIKDLNERLSRDNAALNAVNKELEAFSYSVSHDLRAPLRAIDGFSQALLEDFGDTLPAEGQDYLYRVRRATQRMGALIDDLLALAHVTRSDVHLETVDLSAIATDIVTSLRERDPTRAVAVEIEPGVTMQGDVRLMRLALENLFDNAWKFTSKQDNPRMAFGRMTRNGADVYFIKDNGAGFDMAYADKLFGAFQRLHHHGEFPGSGIGLATVQRIITKHDGKIWAESEPGKGATFFLAF